METVKVGIVGCGMITARRHAPEYTDNPHAQIVGFYDFDQQRAGELAAGYGGKVYASPEELFADPEIDAVSICSPNYTHADYSIQALRAGKHVLCEKPMALTLEDTRRMMDALQRRDLAEVFSQIGNVFEQVLPPGSEIFAIRDRLLTLGAGTACMSGSGSAVVGFFSQEEAARSSAAAMTEVPFVRCVGRG